MSKFSIITVCFNEVDSIEKAINSVLRQTYKDFEYIVIDGGSTDGTKTIIESHSHDIDYYISERDKGIYDAMNKAIKIAKGDYLFFLNANDCFFEDTTLERVNTTSLQHPSADVIHGKVCFFYNQNTPLRHETDDYFNFKNLNGFYLRSLQQQCFFTKKELHNELGLFDEAFRICADYKFMSTAIRLKKNFVFIPETFCIFDMNGISSQQTERRLHEKRKIVLTVSPVSVILRYLVLGTIQRIRSLFL